MRWTFLVPWIAGCTPSVGDTPLRVAFRLEAADVSWDSLQLDVRAVRFQTCPSRVDRLDWPGVPADVAAIPRIQRPCADATTEHEKQVCGPRPWTVGLSSPYDMLGAVRVHAPIGPWCHLDVVMDGSLVAHGTATGGAAVDLDLDLPDLGMTNDVSFGDAVPRTGTHKAGAPAEEVVPLVVELGTGDWLGVVREAITRGDDVSIGPGDADDDALTQRLLVGAALYVDGDADGQLSAKERSEAKLSDLVPLTSAAVAGDTDLSP